MIQIDFFVLLAQIINFGILYYIFHRFFAKKFMAAMDERKQQLEKLKTADDHYESRIALAKQHASAIITESQTTTKKLRAESEDLAKQRSEMILKKAHDDALKILDGGRRELEKERRSMLAQVKKHIIDTSLKLNEKMFASEKNNKAFIEQELEKIGK